MVSEGIPTSFFAGAERGFFRSALCKVSNTSLSEGFSSASEHSVASASVSASVGSVARSEVALSKTPVCWLSCGASRVSRRL